MQQQKKYTGIIVPVVTPLTGKLQLDTAAVTKLFAHIHAAEAEPFILGTTGEAASAPVTVKEAYVRAAVAEKKENSLLYTGISSNVLNESIDFAAFAADAGADVFVATLPSYYALTEKQMAAWFIQLADAVTKPLFIYNIPATTHMSIPVPIIDELSRHPNIAGVKDSERSEERMRQSIALWKDRIDFAYFLGWAAKSADAILLGAAGLVPSTANLYPEIYRKMWQAFVSNDHDTIFQMQELSDQYGALYQQDRTLGESLRRLKELMQEKDICQSHMFPPL